LKVLFNSDDFGLTKSITDGTIDAHVNGVVNSTTLMMNGHAVPYALEEAKKHPNLKVGIHLVLTWGKPLRDDLPSLTRADGYFKFNSLMQDELDVEAVKKEWTAQIEAFLQTGFPLHHIDSHHHVHGDHRLKDVVIDLAKTYDLPVRYMDSLKDEQAILLTEYLYDGFYADGVREDLLDQIEKLPYESVEIMTHPSFIDDDLRAVSSYVEKRADELRILKNLKIPQTIKVL